MNEVNLDELQETIRDTSSMKAGGPDGILNLVLKNNINVLSPIMLKIINTCLKLSYFPKEWKFANILVIRKKKRKKKGSVFFYRPISVLSNVGKNFEQT